MKKRQYHQQFNAYTRCMEKNGNRRPSPDEGGAKYNIKTKRICWRRHTMEKEKKRSKYTVTTTTASRDFKMEDLEETHAITTKL